MTGRRVTYGEASQELGVPEQVLRSWKLRKRVTPVELLRGPGRAGLVPVFDLEDLRPLATAYHQRLARARHAGR